MLSLRRTLAVRFSLTMFVALGLIAGWAILAGRALLAHDLAQVGVASGAAAQAAADVTRDVTWLMGITVALASLATLIGAGWLAGRATRPVTEIADQARAFTPGVTGQRITAHADVEEFARLVEVLNGMLERLDRGVESQRRLIADAGHDLKTPLTVMRGELEVALRGDRSPATYRQVLTSVLDEVDHLAALSDGLLMLARVDADGLEPRRAAVDVGRLLAPLAARWADRLEGRTLTSDLPDPGPIARVDGRLVTLAVDQLLDNIRRHTPPGTTATLCVRGEADTVAIDVHDDGPGQPPDVLPLLFERFYRSDPSRSRGSHDGAGLGLTLVRVVAAAHGGTADAAAAGPAGGLRITLRLPRTG